MTGAGHKSRPTIRAAGQPSLDGFLLACRGPVQRGISPLIDALFDKLDDALYDLADKAGNDRLYARYFDAMRLFRKQSRNIKTIFLAQLQRTAELAASGLVGPDSALSDSVRMEDFALVDEADLEESLAVSNLVSKAESRYHRQLYELGRYLGQLLGRHELSPRANPLGPGAICDAFSAAIRPLHDVELSIRLVLYKLFDKQVMDHLGGIYEQCLSLAVAYGLTPSPARKRSVAGPWPAVRPAPQGVLAPLHTQAVQGSISMGLGQVPFDQLRLLLDRWHASAEPASGVPGAKMVVNTGELVAVLSALQGASPADGPGALAPQGLRARIEGALRAEPQGQPRRRSLGEVDEDTLELVSLLFDSIVQGADLPDPIKALVGRLQIPLVKVALLDKTFFEDSDHPARRLLNRIADAAVGWTEDEERTPPSLYGQIAEIVDRVVGEFDRDLGIFEDLDASLAAHLAEGAPRARALEAQVCAQAAGQERMAVAQRRAQAVIEERLQRGPPVAAVVEAMLNQGWRQVLQAAYLSGGKGSREWRTAVDVVDWLLWSVQPKVTSEDRRKLLRRIPELLRILRGGLAAIAFDQRTLALWLRELQALHLTAMRGAASSDTGGQAERTGTRPLSDGAEHWTPASPGHSDRQDLASPQPPAGPTPDTEAAEPLKRLAPGCWVELVRDDARRVRVKLAWVGIDGQRLQFVDRQGREGPEMARDDLGTLIEYGLASIIRSEEDPPLVDRAIAALARHLSH